MANVSSTISDVLEILRGVHGQVFEFSAGIGCMGRRFWKKVCLKLCTHVAIEHDISLLYTPKQMVLAIY